MSAEGRPVPPHGSGGGGDNLRFAHRDTARWNRYVARCPFAADIPASVVPPISLALAPSVALDLQDGKTTRFRFRRRSDRDQFAAAWRAHGYPVRTFRSQR